MGSNLMSDSKLQYYPTQLKECFKMLPMIGNVQLPRHRHSELKNYLGGDIYDRLIEEYENDKIRCGSNIFLYNYLVDKEDYSAIKEFFTYKISSSEENKTFVITDYFAGEGKWLELIKFIKTDPYYNEDSIYLLANELEQNRYNTIKESGVIDEYYNGSFENLSLPKYHASLTLFNPPYGMDTSSRIRNARRYLQMLIDKDYLYKDIKSESNNGVIIAVLRKDDILDCLDLLVKYFNISTNTIYKVNDEEYQKYKQFVIYGKIRNTPLDDNNISDINKSIKEIEELKNIINGMQELNLYQYNYNYTCRLTPVKYEEIKRNFKYVKNKSNTISKSTNSTWKWIKDITELKDISQESLTLPRSPKLGEMSLIISSGYINGNINLDGKANHVVIGGVKNLTKEETSCKKDKDGNDYIEKTVTKYTRPYLNLLINNKGKVEIKELGGE